MKSNRKKRIIAAVLCMVMVLSSSISALAGEEIFVDIPEASEEFSSEPMVVTETESAGEAFTETEAPVDPETPAEPAPEVPEGTSFTKKLYRNHLQMRFLQKRKISLILETECQIQWLMHRFFQKRRN